MQMVPVCCHGFRKRHTAKAKSVSSKEMFSGACGKKGLLSSVGFSSARPWAALAAWKGTVLKPGIAHGGGRAERQFLSLDNII